MTLNRSMLQGFEPYSYGYVALHGLLQRQKGKNLSASLTPNGNPRVDYQTALDKLDSVAMKFIEFNPDEVYTEEEIGLIPAMMLVYYELSPIKPKTHRISTNRKVYLILGYSKILIKYCSQSKELQRSMDYAVQASKQMLFVSDKLLANAPLARKAMQREMTNLFLESLSQSLERANSIL